MIATAVFLFAILAWPDLALTLAALLRVHGRGMRRAARVYAITWRFSELSRMPIQQRREGNHGADKPALAAGSAQ